MARARATGMKLPELSGFMVRGQFDVLDAAAEGCDVIIAAGLFPSRASRDKDSVLPFFILRFHFWNSCVRVLFWDARR